MKKIALIFKTHYMRFKEFCVKRLQNPQTSKQGWNFVIIANSKQNDILLNQKKTAITHFVFTELYQKRPEEFFFRIDQFLPLLLTYKNKLFDYRPPPQKKLAQFGGNFKWGINADIKGVKPTLRCHPIRVLIIEKDIWLLSRD